MRLVVTGATGFLGAALVDHLRALGHDVRGTSADAARAARGGFTTLPFGAPVPPALWHDVDAVMHCAHDLAPGAGARTTAGTQAIAQAAAQAGVAQQVFVSSFSAHAGADTEYARTKATLDAWFLARGYAVVRPGLIVGTGGVFGRLLDRVRASALLPVIAPGALVTVVGLRDVLTCLTRAAAERPPEVVRAWLDARLSMQDLLTAMRHVTGARVRLVPVPAPLALATARVAETLGMTLPLSSDTVRALRTNARCADPGNLAQWVGEPQAFADALRDAVAPSGNPPTREVA